MPLILAVEPDKRRGRQLSSLVRRFTTAEIVVAPSGAAAITAIGARVPDLILTPALLPTQDEAALTAWLRELGDPAAHVQTVAVPILADADAGPREPGSILGRLLDRSDQAAAHGCDPAVFAEQIKVYLDRAGAERRGRTPAATASPATVNAAPDKDDLDFEEISLDSLVLEPLFIESPAEPPAAELPRPEIRIPDPPRPEKARPPVDTAAMRGWEKELGLGRGHNGSPALWRVTEGLPDEPADDDVLPAPPASEDWQRFDPSQARFQALLRRLDAVIEQHG